MRRWRLLPGEDDAVHGRNAQIAAIRDGAANGSNRPTPITSRLGRCPEGISPTVLCRLGGKPPVRFRASMRPEISFQARLPEANPRQPPGYGAVDSSRILRGAALRTVQVWGAARSSCPPPAARSRRAAHGDDHRRSGSRQAGRPDGVESRGDDRVPRGGADETTEVFHKRLKDIGRERGTNTVVLGHLERQAVEGGAAVPAAGAVRTT
jgi:hypothetical protein